MTFRKATEQDLPEIVAMYSDDKLGEKREDYQLPLPKVYVDAFKCINADQNQELIVAINENHVIVGTLQLTFIQYLNRLGSLRAQIESVHVKAAFRGEGLGKKLFSWAIQRAKDKNAKIIQLTSDKKRPKAIKFYETLGFVASHEGFKLHL